MDVSGFSENNTSDHDETEHKLSNILLRNKLVNRGASIGQEDRVVSIEYNLVICRCQLVDYDAPLGFGWFS